jgi:tetratricopeptide (TPR) repeat protein
MQEVKRTETLSAALILIVALLSLLIKDFGLPLNASALIGLHEGDAPRDVVLNDLDGNPVNVSKHFGNKPVILVFWKLTTNKAFLDYSLDELRFLNNFYKKYHEKTGLEIYALYAPIAFDSVSEEEIASVRNLIKTNGILYPVLIDDGFKMFKEHGVIALPSTIMVGKPGTIEFIYSGFPFTANAIMAGKINELIGNTSAAHSSEKEKKRVADSKADRLYRYALQMFKRGLLEQALSALQKSMDLAPDDSWSHNLKGIILWKKGLIEPAMSELQNAINLNNDNIVARINYIVLLIEQELYEKAEELLLTSPVAEADLKIRSHQLMGTVYANTDRVDRAIKELEKASTLSDNESAGTDISTPSYFSARISILHDLSLLYGKQGKEKKAREVLHEALHAALGLDNSLYTQHLDHRNDLMLYE